MAGDAAAGLLISLETVERAIEIEEWFTAARATVVVGYDEGRWTARAKATRIIGTS